MYIDYGLAVDAERARRKALGLPTLRWYRCHGCGVEYRIEDGVRSRAGCANAVCYNPNIHIHSDLDGEQPNFHEDLFK